MTSQGDLLTCKIPFSERPGSDQMSKFVLKHPDVKNIITRTLMDTSGDAYRIGDAEWDHGLRSDVLYEPMHVSLDQPPIIVEVQAMVNADFMNRAAHYYHFALTDKQFAYNRYARILKKYIKDEAFETNFKIWRKSDSAEDYWIEKIHSSTTKKSRRNAALHIQKAVINEYSQLDKYLERESTLSDTTTNESEYTESEQHSVYRLTFDELNDNSLKSSTSKYVLYKKQTKFNKRMGLSCITFPPAEKLFILKRHSLSDGCYLMIRQFKRAVEETKPSIPADWSQPSDKFWPLLYSMLTYTLNIINIDQKNAHLKQHVVKKSEPDFITKYVTNFLQNIMFAYQDHLFFRWDTSSKAYDESKKKKRPDFIICTSDGFEVGYGEIKPPDTNSNEEKEDRCRVLREYRQITENGAQMRKNLSDIRILSLSYIFLISDDDHCSLSRLLPKQQLAVMKNFNLKQYLEFMEDDVLIACRKMQRSLYNEEMCEEEREDTIDLIKNSRNSRYIKTAVKITKDIIPHIFNKFLNRQEGEANQIIELLRPFLLHCWTSRLTGVKYEWLTYHLLSHPQFPSSQLMMSDYVLFVEPYSSITFELCFVEVKRKGNHCDENNNQVVQIPSDASRFSDLSQQHDLSR
ncbi:hypothetical protein G6F32_008545 [Rhizopus arrhizus]|nr:hypothetical protein G6F32_008545 [Rhizopus arrhizus]